MSEMQVSVESVDKFTRRLNVTVPISQLEEKKEERLTELSKEIHPKGYRRGNVPMSYVKRLYGNSISIWQEVIEKALQISLSIALEQEALNPVGQPHIESIKAEPGADLTYTAIFEIYPHVEVPILKGTSLERFKVDITAEDIDTVLGQMRRQYAEWIEVSDKAGYGDQVSFDIVFADEEEKTRRDLQWILEETKIPKEFSVLLSSVAGDNLPISLPKEQGSEQICSATIKVKKVAKAKLPELDDAFAKRLDIKEGTLEALKTQVKEHMQVELDRILREKLKTQVVDKLVVTHAINELPQGALNQEFQRLEQDVYKQQKQQGKEKISLSEIEKADLMQMAHRRVTLGLLFNALIEKHHLHVDESRVQQHIDKLVGAFQFDQMVRDKLYKDKSMMMSIRSSVLEEQVIDKLLEEVEYTEKVAEYSELMNLTKKNRVGNTEAIVV
jgi:trigger factor